MITLLHIDCLEYMATLEDKAFDLAIVDPPYGIGFDGHDQINGKSGKSKNFYNKPLYIKKDWDETRPSEFYFTEILRVSKNQIIWGGNYFADLLPCSNGWIYFDKKLTKEENTTFSDGELAWSSFTKPLKKFTYGWTGFSYLNNSDREKKNHPTQKPIALYKWLLKNYAKPGDKILDTHGGSMSIAIACHQMGFDLTLCEIDKDYYEAGLKRYVEAIKQQSLFAYQ